MDVEIVSVPQGYQTRSSTKRKSEEGLETKPNKRQKVNVGEDKANAIDLTADIADATVESRTSNRINNTPKNSAGRNPQDKKEGKYGSFFFLDRQSFFSCLLPNLLLVVPA